MTGWCRIDEARRLADAFPVPPRRIEVPGAGHSNVVGTGGEELVRRIAEFLDGRMCDARPVTSILPSET